MATNRGPAPAAPPPTTVALYEEWTPDDAVDAAEAVAKQSEAGNYFKLRPGDNVLRILPTRKGLHPTPIMVTWNHDVRDGSSNDSKGVGFLCARKHKAGWSCPACQKLDELRATGNPADYKAAAMCLPKIRAFANVIDRSDEEAGPQTFAFGKMIYEGLMAYRSRDRNLDIPFTNIDDSGCDVIVKKTGEKKDTEYHVRTAPRCSALTPDEGQAIAWLQAMRDLTQETMVLSEEEVLAKLDELSSGGRDGGGRGGRPALPARGDASTWAGRAAPARTGNARAGARPSPQRTRSVVDDVGELPTDEELPF
jgi:hypothetical protein